MATPKVNLAERAAQRAKEHPSFLGYALALYQQSHGQNDVELAGWLGCAVDQMNRLSLCRRPLGADATFRRDVESIAEFAGINTDRLVQVLRATESIIALRHAAAAGSAGSPPLRLAARVTGKADGYDEPGGGEGEGP